MRDLERKENNMDCGCINLTFLISFYLLGIKKLLTSKKEHLCASIHSKTLAVFSSREAHANYARVLYLQEITLLAAILAQPNHKAFSIWSYRSSIYRVHWLNLGPRLEIIRGVQIRFESLGSRLLSFEAKTLFYMYHFSYRFILIKMDKCDRSKKLKNSFPKKYLPHT